VLRRAYVYRIINQDAPPSIFDEPWAWHVREPLSLTDMQVGSEHAASHGAKH